MGERGAGPTLENIEDNKKKLGEMYVGLVDRVLGLAEEYCPGKSSMRRFAEKCGLSPYTIYNWHTYRSAPSKLVIDKILAGCPEINREWLLTGDAPKRNEDATQKVRAENASLGRKRLTKMLEDVRRENEMQRGEIRRLKEQIELMQKLIAAYSHIIDKSKL